MADAVLSCWFGEIRPRQWFGKARRLHDRVLALCEQALAGSLAPLLLLDHLPRQIWRGSAKPFSGDPQALDMSQAAVARRHRDVIAHFGHFPHRNAALGRASNAEERALLELPGSRF